MTIIKLTGIFILIFGIMVGAFYWYFSYSQNEINTLEQTTAKLTQAIQIQQQAMADQVAFQKQQNQDLADLQTSLQAANDAKNALESEFLNTDMNAQAIKDAQALENKMNADTAAALQTLERLTALPLATTRK